MSFPVELLERLPQYAPTERRANTRFPVTLELRYTASGSHPPLKIGTGRTIDLSGSGLRFTADTPLLTGQNIQVYIDKENIDVLTTILERYRGLLEGDIVVASEARGSSGRRRSPTILWIAASP